MMEAVLVVNGPRGLTIEAIVPSWDEAGLD